MFVKGKEGIYEEALLEITQIAEAEASVRRLACWPLGEPLISSQHCQL